MSQILRNRLARWLAFSVGCAGIVVGQSNNPLNAKEAERESGIPVTDPVVVAKCGSCHTRDERGNMLRISWERTTPEGWQQALRRMILANRVSLTTAEARSIVKYLSTSHGLAPQEARPVMYDAERRIHDETGVANEKFRDACSKCHGLGRLLSWRRSVEDWKKLAETHAALYKASPSEEAITFLSKAAALHTPEWATWSTSTNTPNVAGRWLVTASIPGRGKYYGEMQVDPAGAEEFTSSVHLTSVNDGSSVARSGRSVVYGGYAWRGRSKGGGPASSAPDDLSSEAREALWFAPDQLTAEGRWFWGEYQEFGFDLKLRRGSSDATLMVVDRPSLKAGSQANRVRLIGDHIPDKVTPGDLHYGPGVSVRRIVSHTANEVVAEVDVASNAKLGRRDVALGRAVLSGAIAIYDRVDYIQVTPESSMAAFGDRTHGQGYQQFDAIGYQRGADGELHTDDDVELGPVDVTWSMEVFYAAPGSSSDHVGKVSATGLFTPSVAGSTVNFDVWTIATAKSEKDKNGKPLAGKSYMVVTVPTYTFNGRKYVRDLDRWVDDGPAQGK